MVERQGRLVPALFLPTTTDGPERRPLLRRAERGTPLVQASLYQLVLDRVSASTCSRTAGGSSRRATARRTSRSSSGCRLGPGKPLRPPGLRGGLRRLAHVGRSRRGSSPHRASWASAVSSCRQKRPTALAPSPRLDPGRSPRTPSRRSASTRRRSTSCRASWARARRSSSSATASPALREEQVGRCLYRGHRPPTSRATLGRPVRPGQLPRGEGRRGPVRKAAGVSWDACLPSVCAPRPGPAQGPAVRGRGLPRLRRRSPRAPERSLTPTPSSGCASS